MIKWISILLFTINSSILGAADSKEFKNIYNEVISLKKENEVLSDRVENLSKINDKFLTVTYSTIGFCLMTIIGLSIWNGVSSSRLDKRRYNNFLDEFRREINTTLDEEISEKIDTKVGEKLIEIERIKGKLIELEISMLTKSHKRFQNNDSNQDDYTASIKYLRLSNQRYQNNKYLDFDLKDALRNLRDLLNEDKDWIDAQIDEIVTILPEIDSSFDRYVNEIKEIIKI